ncbi:DUF2867 domain-containing protein [Luteibacter aegosomaticola]|uniref:DUF2867 domain-containing protein n=1 Tax=Luteibacter aegosomaticola TaxID=2911538 RepID=UPI001FF9E810|nr:DUF2867 domain-containing protein [Luteibacter aegosomaticola]UPG90033.1 DUF2867 domain-containing protein [Luteibacter aegosomaticola]
MSYRSQATASFPSATIVPAAGGLPVEVNLIAQIGHGAGSQLVASAGARQRAHASFIDELDEPSARLGGTHFEHGDATSLYTFAVGAKGHPFHRHAGHRVFTAVSGSGGALLRFSTATSTELADDPANFARALRHITIPPDCLFTVRFGGGTWHQFLPLQTRGSHPAFFALSCHTNELGGELEPDLRERVLAGEASIPALTEVLPDAVQAWLARTPVDQLHVPTMALALEAAPDSLQVRFCGFARRMLGALRARLASLRHAGGFLSATIGWHTVVELGEPEQDSLLRGELNEGFHHEDTFRLPVAGALPHAARAEHLLASLLDGFIKDPPRGVTRLMALRNTVVKPLGLRTSTLGCPVSSLLGPVDQHVFAGRFPVHTQRIAADGSFAQVILGANDRHLRFRSCIAVRVTHGRVDVTMGTRVRCHNLFGRVYIRAIRGVHRHYVSPTMLRRAVGHAFPTMTLDAAASPVGGRLRAMGATSPEQGLLR